MKHKSFQGRIIVMGLVAAGFAASASAMTPGGGRKKFVALNFDVFLNSPSNVLAHAEKLNAVPWLDGVTVMLRDVPVKTADGETVLSESTRLMKLGHTWSRDGVRDQIPYLRGIVGYPRLKESFLMAWITPSGKENRISWSDDAGWKLFAENLAVLAWLAKESGLKGLMLDPEEYSAALQYFYTAAEKDLTFADCARLARQRGREVFSRVFAEFPDGVYFFLWTFEHHVRHFADAGSTDPQGVSDDAGELLSCFFNGMLDVMPPTVRFVDGAEHYSLTATKDMYWKDALNQLVGAHAFVAPENWAKYRGQLLVGNTHYLDMFSQLSNPRSHWHHGPVNGSRLEHLRLNLVQSLQVADEYVWVYGEGGRLIDWACGPTQWQTDKRKLWEDQIPGLSETMMLAKDPDALFELRKAECAARGELKNLVAGSANLPAKFAFTGEAKHFASRVTRSVKGVRPKEVYEVGQRINFKMDGGHPDLVVSWRAKGRDVPAEAQPPLAYFPGEPKKRPYWLRGFVTVPEGADEMVLTFAADLRPGESASAAQTEVFKVCDAPEPAAAASGGKWTFDEKKRRLTDGNWDLLATYEEGDATKTRLAVNGTKAVGSGALDFTNVERDTGKKVVRLDRFNRNGNLTALVGPDVCTFGSSALGGCTNLTQLSFGDAKAFADEQERRTFLREGRSRAGALVNLVPRDAPKFENLRLARYLNVLLEPRPSVRVKSGELYGVSLSCRMTAYAGYRFFYVKWRKDGQPLAKDTERMFTMRGPRQDGTWRPATALVRAPAEADELVLEVGGTLEAVGETLEYDKVEIFKLGEPLPVWPAECEREREK